MQDALLFLSTWITKRLHHLWARIIPTVFLFPSLAIAHGDDHVTAASFIGPILAFATVVTVVGLGQLLLRALVRKG